MIELLEHNKETYRKLCEVLETNNKCALVQATGTGKSYIAGKYIEEHAGKALVLVPTNAISDAWDELLEGMEEKFDIVTYQAFAKEPGNYFDYDLVIADEMHHLGSDVWGAKFVDTYLQNENHKINVQDKGHKGAGRTQRPSGCLHQKYGIGKAGGQRKPDG